MPASLHRVSIESLQKEISPKKLPSSRQARRLLRGDGKVRRAHAEGAQESAREASGAGARREGATAARPEEDSQESAGTDSSYTITFSLISNIASKAFRNYIRDYFGLLPKASFCSHTVALLHR